MKRFLIPFLATTLLASAALAQNADPNARIDRLERDLMLMQRQIARGEPVTGSRTLVVGETDQASPSLDVRLSSMEEEMRKLNGKNEELEFQIKKLTENLEKMQRDTDFRFKEIQPNSEAHTDPTAVPPEERKPLPATETPPATVNDAPPGQSSAGDGTLRTPEEDSRANTPRDLYNQAFRLLNQTKYEEAAGAFESFTKQYPKDPLIGNAYYWLGETYYIRRDYVSAADSFRQGFEALPAGPKAADNLLKLAMTLDALNRDKEACVVLEQITTKFKKSSVSINNKAEQEQKRINCK